VAVDDRHLNSHLQRKFYIGPRTHTKPHQLEANGVERHEAQNPRPLELVDVDRAVQSPVFDVDPFFGFDGDDVASSDHLAPSTPTVVHSDVERRRPAQERQAEQSHARFVPRYVTVCSTHTTCIISRESREICAICVTFKVYVFCIKHMYVVHEFDILLMPIYVCDPPAKLSISCRVGR